MTSYPVDQRIWRVVGDPLVPGTAEGPLAGLTLAVKDVVAVAGFAVGAGVPAWLEDAEPEPRHAVALQRLLAAGAGVAGIARTDQLAYSLAGTNEHYGAPPNPAVPEAIPGGSTSGSAAAVALGEADLGLGTDTAGSIRVPASYQGLWGIRTTHGAVDRTGVLPLAPSFDTVGVLARDAPTLAAATQVVLDAGAGRRPFDPAFVVAPRLLDGVEDDVLAVFEAALTGVRPLDEVWIPDPAEMAEAFRVHQAWQAWQTHGTWIQAHPDALLGDVRQRFEVASRVTAAEDDAARAALDRLRRELDAALGARILVVPTAASSAPPLEGGSELRERARAATLRLTCVAGVTGRPGVTAPALRTDGGPVGLSLLGPPQADVQLLRLATRLPGPPSHAR
jgi:Asp-tRNA(Asn)/Glu-tRNA(Gln) amidotransferase A subunit family amidase